MILDSITIRLQSIGEIIKKAKAANTELFLAHNKIDWDQIIQFRDLISHHYELLNYEVVFDICKFHLPNLKAEIEKILLEISPKG